MKKLIKILFISSLYMPAVCTAGKIELNAQCKNDEKITLNTEIIKQSKFIRDICAKEGSESEDEDKDESTAIPLDTIEKETIVTIQKLLTFNEQELSNAILNWKPEEFNAIVIAADYLGLEKLSKKLMHILPQYCLKNHSLLTCKKFPFPRTELLNNNALSFWTKELAYKTQKINPSTVYTSLVPFENNNFIARTVSGTLHLWTKQQYNWKMNPLILKDPITGQLLVIEKIRSLEKKCFILYTNNKKVYFANYKESQTNPWNIELIDTLDGDPTIIEILGKYSFVCLIPEKTSTILIYEKNPKTKTWSTTKIQSKTRKITALKNGLGFLTGTDRGQVGTHYQKQGTEWITNTTWGKILQDPSNRITPLSKELYLVKTLEQWVKIIKKTQDKEKETVLKLDRDTINNAFSPCNHEFMINKNNGSTEIYTSSLNPIKKQSIVTDHIVTIIKLDNNDLIANLNKNKLMHFTKNKKSIEHALLEHILTQAKKTNKKLILGKNSWAKKILKEIHQDLQNYYKNQNKQ